VLAQYLHRRADPGSDIVLLLLQLLRNHSGLAITRIGVRKTGRMEGRDLAGAARLIESPVSVRLTG
jgi:hypothetical protein